MKINSFCMSCLVQAQARNIQKFEDEEKKSRYMREIFKLLLDSDPELSAPALLEPVTKLYESYWGSQEGFQAEKKSFNDFLLSMEEELEKKIRSTKDPLATALCYARLGNYIDLSALSDVSTEKLLELFAKAEEESLDAEEYQHFLQDLKHGEYLVYLTDNCGEVVLDKLVIKLLKEQYPKLRIEVLVRGIPVTNDVDIEGRCRICGIDKTCSRIWKWKRNCRDRAF